MSKHKSHFLFILSLIVLGVFSRLIPHAPNATAIGAVAIFGGFAFRNSITAFAVLLASLFISDLVINNVLLSSYYDGFTWFTSGFIYIYLGFALSILLGMYLKQSGRYTISRAYMTAVVSVAAFFLLTNFGAWAGNPMYPQSLSGLLTALVAGIPFAVNQLIFTILYGTVLFAAYGWYTSRYPAFA